MIYKVRLKKWIDDTISITDKQELNNLTTKAYYDYVQEVFTDHQTGHGQDEEEAADAFSSQEFKTIEKFLVKSGYDLTNDFLYRNS
jgi:hypothetical protein